LNLQGKERIGRRKDKTLKTITKTSNLMKKLSKGTKERNILLALHA